MVYNKAYYDANTEKFLAMQAAWREKNREKERLRHKIYRQANKDKHAGYERKRRAIKRQAVAEFYTTEDVLNLHGTNCHICNKPIDLLASRRVGRQNWENGLHIDHIIPISKQGSDTLENVRPSHGLCNLKKNRYRARKI